jgi:hypothetical protein
MKQTFHPVLPMSRKENEIRFPLHFTVQVKPGTVVMDTKSVLPPWFQQRSREGIKGALLYHLQLIDKSGKNNTLRLIHELNKPDIEYMIDRFNVTGERS